MNTTAKIYMKIFLSYSGKNRFADGANSNYTSLRMAGYGSYFTLCSGSG